MTARRVQLLDVVPSPWRNGGGTTRELVAWPLARDWVWRMSVAEIERSGPFSRFDGVQRWFAVLSGAGVALQIGARRHDLTGDSAPLCFDAGQPVDCRLTNGATQDFNLMLRRDQASAQMKRVSGPQLFTLNAPKIIAVYAQSTGATVCFDHKNEVLEGHSLSWQALGAGTTVQVAAADALWMEIEVAP